MQIDRIYHVSHRPVPGRPDAAFVTPADLPIAAERLRALDELWTYGLGADDLAALLAEARPALLSIARSRNGDLGVLAAQHRLRALAIDWNTKIRALDMLAGLETLEILSLQDLKHVHDLAPLGGLGRLRGLQIAGGMDTRMELETLAPLAGLAALEDLRLANVRIGDLSLVALAGLPGLKRLSLPGNIAPQEQYARLAALLPGVECDMFQPYVPIEGGPLMPGEDPVAALDRLGDGRVMVTGKGLPTLRARADRDRLLRYCARFRAG